MWTTSRRRRVRLQLRSGAQARQAAVDREWEKSKHRNFKKVKHNFRCGPTGEAGRATCSFRIPHEQLPSRTLRARGTSPKTIRRGSCFQETTSNVTVDPEQYSQNKEHQLLKWRLLGKVGEANIAVSAYTQVHMLEASRQLRLPAEERPQVRLRLAPSRRPKPWEAIEEPTVPLERYLYGPPLAGLLWVRTFEKYVSKQIGQ